MNAHTIQLFCKGACAGLGVRARRCRKAVAGVLLVALAGCQLPPAEENGELLHHNWWNYYARGSYLFREGRTEEAQADFQRCLGLMPGAKFGNVHDMWRARTYGLHFVEGYFPNRELGICLFERGDVSQAVRFLETSLRQEPSGRAKHYLNRALQKQLSGRAVPGPQLRVDSDGTDGLTRARACRMTGTASGDGRIRALTVNGKPEFIELAEPSRAFSRSVALKAGTNVVSVVAEDLLGQRVTRQVVRIADWQPPRLVLKRAVAQGREWLVEGVCRDEFGVAEIALGATVVFHAEAARVAGEVPVSLRVSDAEATLTVTDRAGNKLECPLSAAALGQLAAMEQAHPQFAGVPPMSAFGWSAPEPMLFAVGRLLSLTTPAPSADRLRPSLSLRGCQPVTRVFAEDFFVDGTASDGGGLASVTVNGEDLLAQEDRGSARAYFARRLPLDVGTNSFEIVALDRAGNRAVQALTVVRLLPEYLDERYRLSVGVPPLVPGENGSVGLRVKRSIEAEMTRSPVRFRLLERNEGWDYVLREQGLSVSDLADPSAALRIGKMVPAELLFMGKIFSESKGVTIYLKAVETSNGEVVFASDVYSPNSDLSLDDAVSGLVLKVGQGFPLITGEVLRCQGTSVTLNVGRQEGTTENSRFLVVKAPDKGDLASGQVCQAAGQAVQLQIERIQQNTSTARIIPSAADAIVKEGYYVYTR